MENKLGFAENLSQKTFGTRQVRNVWRFLLEEWRVGFVGNWEAELWVDYIGMDCNAVIC